MDIDWQRYWTVAQDVWRYLMILIALQFAWTFVRRVQRRSQQSLNRQKRPTVTSPAITRDQRFLELNNNNNYINEQHLQLKTPFTPVSVAVCHRGTQWEEQPETPTATAAPKQKEGLTAQKIKQLLTQHSTNAASRSSRCSDKRGINSIKTLHGHVSDLKLRFEDGEAAMREQKQFQKAVDSVKVVNRFALPKTVDKDPQQEEEEEQDNVDESPVSTTDEETLSPPLSPPPVILRRKRIPSTNSVHELPKYKLLNEFGGSVHSLEDILSQQRFSRSLSQYSVSELCFNESPAEINRNCERFDELFCRSMEDLLVDQERTMTAEEVNGELGKFASMVDVVNL